MSGGAAWGKQPSSETPLWKQKKLWITEILKCKHIKSEGSLEFKIKMNNERLFRYICLNLLQSLTNVTLTGIISRKIQSSKLLVIKE